MHCIKQVPSCEFFPIEAVKTNVLGTENVLTAAIEEGVKSVICLSTDKAAYPVNAMGTSKAMMEKVIVAKSRTVDPEKTKICCTRYGNVMCSRGSVIPLWIEQIKSRKSNHNYRTFYDQIYYEFRRSSRLSVICFLKMGQAEIF